MTTSSLDKNQSIYISEKEELFNKIANQLVELVSSRAELIDFGNNCAYFMFDIDDLKAALKQVKINLLGE